MLLTKFYRNVVGTTLHCLNKHVNYKYTKAFLSNHNRSKIRHLRIVSSPNFMQCRNYSNESQSQVVIPPLSDGPLIVVPGFFKAIKCKFLMQRYIESTEEEFLEGSRQAVHIVSNALANQDYESISGLVTPDVIQYLKNKIDTLTPEQKQLIAINKKDIFMSFPYQIEITSDENKDQKLAEITVVHYSLRGLHKEANQAGRLYETMFADHPDLFICNYRYIGELAGGVETSWTINMINQFHVSSYNEQRS